MTDDLVKRLRHEHLAMTRTEAADRIEALEQEVERRIEPEQVEKLIEMAEPILAEVYAAECAYRKEAEARLAKAVDVLREIERLVPKHPAGEIARATLAEIGGA